jgi:hypothetical protein
MSDEPAADRDVLANLPRTRPARRSAKRDEAPAQPAAKRKPAAKPKAPAKPKAAAKAKPVDAARPKRRTPASSHERLTPPDPVAERRDGPPAAGYAVPEPDPHPPSGDLISTATEAAVAVAKLSMSFGMRLMRVVADQSPRSRRSRGHDDGR